MIENIIMSFGIWNYDYAITKFWMFYSILKNEKIIINQILIHCIKF